MRSPLFLTLLAAAFAAPALTAQPVVNAVENNFSYVLPGLPNYGIAQGSIFVVFGTNLAGASSALQSIPLQTSLDGVSVQISVGGAVTQALLYYVMPTQIAGVLPSATPFGTGQITVTVNGQASAPASITVVQSVFGIDSGFGAFGRAAHAYDVNSNPLSAVNAANPGDTIAFYGTGAGPVPGNEAEAPVSQNLTNIPIEVDIGGVPATVTYHGRSGSPGLDQINVVVPAGVAGCNVSLAVISSGLVSNTAMIPVAPKGRACSDAVPGVTLSVPAQLTGESVYTTGQINMSRLNQIIPPVTVGTKVFPPATVESDNASALFQRTADTQPFSLVFGGSSLFPSLGNCSVLSALFPAVSSSPTPSLSRLVNNASPEASAIPPGMNMLNAGPAVNFTDSNGKASATLGTSGYYSGILGGNGKNPLFLPASGGVVTIDNGSGGPDVASFTAQVTVAPPVVWTNESAIPASINRAQGVTLTWTGGNPAGIASITAQSSVVNAAGQLNVQVQCNVPVASGQFTIPASVLLALPPSSLTAVGKTIPSTFLSISTQDQSMFSAAGLDAGIIFVGVQDSLMVPYQ
jgi:uncharacterized protein (TIGR03437 family)